MPRLIFFRKPGSGFCLCLKVFDTHHIISIKRKYFDDRYQGPKIPLSSSLFCDVPEFIKEMFVSFDGDHEGWFAF